MARLRLPLVFGPNALQAAAPTHQLVPGSLQPVTPAKTNADGVLLGVSPGDPALQGISVLADVPDEDVTNGALDPQKIKQRYPDHFLVRNGIIK